MISLHFDIDQSQVDFLSKLSHIYPNWRSGTEQPGDHFALSHELIARRFFMSSSGTRRGVGSDCHHPIIRSDTIRMVEAHHSTILQ